MGVIAKYKFNQTIYENFIPEFNSAFTDYTIIDEIDTDGYTIRTIESDSLPTSIRFGAETQTDREKSLLEVYECNTENVTSMNNMFRYCTNLILLDTSHFNTSNVTNMEGMFQNCSSLISLDVSSFNTSKVTSMSYMFLNCSSLTSLNLSNFNTNNVTSMDNMFRDCSLLTSLGVSNFNTSQVTDMSSMFYSCKSLISLDTSNFNTEKVTNMQNMFNGCSSLTSLDVSNFNTSIVTKMNGMFDNCPLLTSLDVSNFNTEKVTNMQNMFNLCSSLTSLDTSNFDTSQVTTMGGMFNGCSSLALLDVSNFNTEKVINMYGMFRYCSSLTSLDISNFNTEKATDMSWMFTDVINLTDIGMIYCNSNTINKISDLITTDTTIWYSDAKLEDLTKKENITYKEYKMNILESDEEIVLRKIGDVYDELNLETGELTQRIGEIVLDGSEEWIKDMKEDNDTFLNIVFKTKNDNITDYNDLNIGMLSDKFKQVTGGSLWSEDISGIGGAYSFIKIGVPKSYLTSADSDGFKQWLSQNPVTVQYQFATESVKTVDLKNKPSINWQDDTYLHLENNTLYPQLDCEVESINYYEIPKLKANTLYTLRYVGEPTQCIFGGLTYRTENNMILTSGSSDNLLYFDKKVRKVVLIEGDVRDRNFDYFEGIESLGAVEIVTHKSDMSIFSKVQLPPHIQLHRLPDGTCDELDIETGILTRRIDENYNLLEEEVTEKLILNYNNSCNYGVILPRGTSDNYNVITNEYRQNLDFIPIDGSIAFDTATIKDTTVKYTVALSKFEIDTTNVRGSDGIYYNNDLFKYETSDNDYEHAYIENDTTLHIYVNKSRLSSYDQVGFQMYLTNNPFDLYYAIRNTIISYVNYEDLNPEKASWEMLDCTEDGSITIESGNMDKTLLLDCMDYVAPTKNRFEIDLLKANTQYTVYAEGVSSKIQLNFGGNVVNFTSGNVYTSGETQLVEFYTNNEIKNLIIIEGDTRTETIDFFEGLKSSENVTVISSNAPFVFGKGGKIQ